MQTVTNIFKMEETDSAYYYFNKAKNRRNKRYFKIINSLSWMAQIQDIKVTTWERSHSCRGTPFYENTDKYPNGKWNIYNQLGNNYLYTLNFDNALIIISIKH
jgi:hypothetical protein